MRFRFRNAFACASARIRPLRCAAQHFRDFRNDTIETRQAKSLATRTQLARTKRHVRLYVSWRVRSRRRPFFTLDSHAVVRTVYGQCVPTSVGGLLEGGALFGYVGTARGYISRSMDQCFSKCGDSMKTFRNARNAYLMFTYFLLP